jgi:hypothetical protein
LHLSKKTGRAKRDDDVDDVNKQIQSQALPDGTRQSQTQLGEGGQQFQQQVVPGASQTQVQVRTKRKTKLLLILYETTTYHLVPKLNQFFIEPGLKLC